MVFCSETSGAPGKEDKVWIFWIKSDKSDYPPRTNNKLPIADIADPQMIKGVGKLDLISYDEKTGIFRYKFSVDNLYLLESLYGSSKNDLPLPGPLIFNIDGKPYSIVEGKFVISNGQPTITQLSNSLF